MRWEHHSFFIPSDHCFRQCWCFAGFEVTLKFGMKQLLHFRGFICLKATLCYVNTLSNWKIPSCIYGRTCYTFRYYLEKLWLLMWAFHRPWWCFSLSIQDCKLGENHRQKWKFERQFFSCWNTRTLTEKKGSCVCISSYCLCRRKWLQMLQKLLSSSCQDS